MPRKPRIITETINRLTKLADHLEKMFPFEAQQSEIISDAVLVLRELAKNLDTQDARETRKDPSKRKAAKR